MDARRTLNFALIASFFAVFALLVGACQGSPADEEATECAAEEAVEAAAAAAAPAAAAAVKADHGLVAAGATAAAAAPAAAPVAAGEPLKMEGTSYGKGISQPESVDIKKLLANVDDYVGKEVRVEGLVTGVCPKRGCWFDMAGDEPGEAVRFKVRDGVMVFPMEDKGKYAVAQGVVRKIPMDLEQSKKYAKYQRDSYGADMDPDKITEPLTIVRLDGTGAVIRDAK